MTTAGRELNSTDEQDLVRMTILSMSDFAFFLINGPLLVLNLLANIFFVFCLMTHKTQQVKQPLKLLLGSMVSFTILYVLSVTLSKCVGVWVNSIVVIRLSYVSVSFLMHGSMTTYAWLMFYYYTMIVPSQRALFLWTKKNIKSVIYAVMLLDGLIFLGVAASNITFIIDYSRFNNGTELVQTDIRTALFSIVYIYLFLCMDVMIISCFATAHYLNKHMKSLSASNGSLSNPRLHSQIRVTVTGILQGVLCFLYGIWSLVYVMTNYVSPYSYFNSNIIFTAINLYILGSTVNLGVGQTLFRGRAVHVWKAVKKRLCTLRPPGDNDIAFYHRKLWC